MSKKKSRIKYVLLAIAAVIGILLSVLTFNIPFTNHKYVGFANAISLGLDLKGGVLAVYECETPEGGDASNFDNAMEGTISRLTNLLTNAGYSEASITREGTNKVRIEVPDVSDPDELFEIIGEPAELLIRDKQDTSAEPVMNASDIQAVQAGQNPQTGEWGVSVQFTYEGGIKFSNLTANASQLFFYLGDAEEPFSSPTVSEQITGGSTFISGNMDQQTAEEYALKITSGTFSLNLTLLENNVVSATLGKDALKWGIIAGAIGLAVIMILMIAIYRDLGLLASFSLVFYTILMLFFLQALPIVQLTLPGIAGVILSLGMAVDGNIVIFERIKDEYALGKKIPSAVQAGVKKSRMAIIDANVTTVIASLVLYILGTGAIKGFALTLLIGTVISVFSTLVITKKLLDWYLPLNSTKPGRLNLKRENTVNEIG